MRNVSVKLRVIDVEPRTINIKGEERLFGGNIGDKVEHVALLLGKIITL